jgi:hypothetical protein
MFQEMLAFQAPPLEEEPRISQQQWRALKNERRKRSVMTVAMDESTDMMDTMQHAVLFQVIDMEFNILVAVKSVRLEGKVQ